MTECERCGEVNPAEIHTCTPKQSEPVIQARKEWDLIVVDLPRVPIGGGGISKREWVGLTDEEIEQLAVAAGIITWVKRVYDPVDKKFYDLPLGEGMEGDGISLKQFASLVSMKLKEQNGG